MTEEQWMTIPEAADLYTVSTKTIRRWIADGELEAKRFGPRLIRIKRQSVANLGRALTTATARWDSTNSATYRPAGYMDADGKFTPACYEPGADETWCVKRPGHDGMHRGYILDGPNDGEQVEW